MMDRFGLRATLAAVASLFALVAASPASAAFPEGAGCPDWTDGSTAFIYENFDLPECRLGVASLRDYGTQALELEGTQINMRRDLERLLPNLSEKRQRIRWPLVDSFGRTPAYITREADHWSTWNLKNRPIYSDCSLDLDPLTVQGRG